MKFTENFGKPVCVALYAAFSFLAAVKTWIPLAALAVMHFTEYIVIGRKVAKKCGINAITGFFNCLAFGFTWWLPLKNKTE